MLRLVTSARENMGKQETVRSLDTCLEIIRTEVKRAPFLQVANSLSRVALLLAIAGFTTITIGCATSKVAHGPSPS